MQQYRQTTANDKRQERPKAHPPPIFDPQPPPTKTGGLAGPSASCFRGTGVSHDSALRVDGDGLDGVASGVLASVRPEGFSDSINVRFGPLFGRTQGMPKKRFQPEGIIGKLRHADVLLGQGKKIAEIVKALGVTEVTYHP